MPLPSSPESTRPWVGFLRGMNLGRRRITNDELCAAFERLGFEGATAFLASGNVIFGAEEADHERLGRRVERGLERELGYAVPAFLRTAAEVRAIAGRAPFAAGELEGRGKPQVMLLGSVPSSAARRAVRALASADDLLVLDRRELYWLPRAGILDSALDHPAIERAVGRHTMRTLRTLERLAGKLGR